MGSCAARDLPSPSMGEGSGMGVSTRPFRTWLEGADASRAFSGASSATPPPNPPPLRGRAFQDTALVASVACAAASLAIGTR